MTAITKKAKNSKLLTGYTVLAPLLLTEYLLISHGVSFEASVFLTPAICSVLYVGAYAIWNKIKSKR